MIRRASFALITACVIVCQFGGPGALRADQVRDWMFNTQPGGTYLNTDVVLPGLQAQLEHRIPIYGDMNELNLRLNALPTLFFYESQVDADLRVLFLTLGASAGFRDTFANISFEPGEPFDREARRQAARDDRERNVFNGYAEGRATLTLPFNDWMALQSINAMRFEGGPDRTFDWWHGIVRDSGVYWKSNTTFFFHHREFGAIGPQLEVLSYELDGRRNTQLNYGFTYVGRVGLRRRFDMFYLSALFAVDGQINGVDTTRVYGDHYVRFPVVVLAAYRIVWELNGPAKIGE